MAAKPRILDVGQCSYDHGSISRHLVRTYGAEVAQARTAAEAVRAVQGGGFDLVLVNRQLDLDGSPGVDIIRTLKADPETAKIPVMLVSNFAAAQSEAEALGALPGFGKNDLRTGSIPALDQALIPST